MDIEDVEIEGEPTAWDMLSPEQKKYFKKLTEKTDEKMNYIG